MNRSFLFLCLTLIISGCSGNHFVIKNIDNTSRKPQYPKGFFVFNEIAPDKQYAFSKEFPINLGFDQERVNFKNVDLYFKSLLGPNGEEIEWKKVATCCPFESKKSPTGAGTLEVYEVKIKGDTSTYTFYINLYEKGKIMCPQGFSIRLLE
jgi:hypothetical protein